ncbi:MAG: cytochrome c3 family protein [Coriobacteriia bacterium]
MSQSWIIRERRMPVALSVLLLLTLLLVVPSVAVAYPEPIGGATGVWPFNQYTCDQCHATSGENTAKTGSGPHKNYAATTKKCELCHAVHDAASPGVKLLMGSTVSKTCLICHDGTGAKVGVYTSIRANGGTVRGEHSIETTNVIPGGSATLSENLSCAHCHSVHGTNTVVPFLRDSGAAGQGLTYIAPQAYVTSDCLLRNDVFTGVKGSVPEYGAMWCAACHNRQHSNTAGLSNHPVDADPAWGYGDVTSTILAGSYRTQLSGTTATSMGRTNSGYVMASVEATGDGRVEARRAPMCQQCHEDFRDVESRFSADYAFRGTQPGPLPTNPTFLTFPHQTTSAKLIVEEWNDLCLNCHAATALP